VRAAIVTISSSRAQAVSTGAQPPADGSSAQAPADESGERLAGLAERLGIEVAGRDLVPDERSAIEERLRHWTDVERCELVMTTGGTGFAPTDVTPEATRAVIEREAPGIPEAMRAASRPRTRNWMLSRRGGHTWIELDRQFPRISGQHRAGG
jgi:molybdopterin adenylyltransferase